MKYGILGTGDVAKTIASALIKLGNEVMIGGRDKNNEKALLWKNQYESNAYIGSYNDVASFGERLFICVQGIHAIEAIKMAGVENFNGKIVIDQTNPYHYSDGHISLDSKYSGSTCLGEEIQKVIPNALVVKTLNYIGSCMMTNPKSLDGELTAFYCGNDENAKEAVSLLLKEFGWTDTFDLGDISMSRYTEMLGAFWVPVLGRLGHMNWGFKLVRK